MDVPTITTECASCGRPFEQPDDPGRKRKFCSNACRQSAYRARAKATAQEQAKARERAEQKERERRQKRHGQSSYERSQRTSRQRTYGTAKDWWSPRPTDTPAQAKARATCARLMERAEHSKSNEHEASACRQKAEQIRKTKGL